MKSEGVLFRHVHESLAAKTDCACQDSSLPVTTVTCSLSLSLSLSQDVVKAIENTPTGPQDRPKTPVVIKDCGTLPLDKPYNIEI